MWIGKRPAKGLISYFYRIEFLLVSGKLSRNLKKNPQFTRIVLNFSIRIKWIVPLVMMVMWLTGCTATIRYGTPSADSGKPTPEIDTGEYDEVLVLATETGTASYYADKFHGRLTANGEVFDMYKVSAAHPKYPLETIVRVTNLKNDRQLVIRINDRMPNFKGRVIDLSYQAAKELGMIADGITEVKIEVLEWGNGKKVK